MNLLAVLITGCSSGIGRDIAFELWKRGYTIFASCRQQQDLSRLNEFVKGRPGARRFIPILLDVTSRESIHAAKLEVNGMLEKLDVRLHAVVNNAGLFTVATV